MEKRILLLTIIFFIITLSIQSQVKPKTGSKPQAKGTSSQKAPNKLVISTFTDSRDGKIYKTVKIGRNTWMAENLAYNLVFKQEICYWSASLKNKETHYETTRYEYNIFCNSEQRWSLSIKCRSHLNDGSWYKGQYYFYKFTFVGYKENGESADIEANWVSMNADVYKGDIYYENAYIGNASDVESAGVKIAEYSFNHQPKPENTSNCYSYENSEKNANEYGYLYNWESANKVCPSGWHLPCNDDWTWLINDLGDESDIVGTKLKESGTTHWYRENTKVTNKSKFTALPGGRRDINGSYKGLGSKGLWWTSSESDSGDAWYWQIDDANYVLNYGGSKMNGLSVRCISNATGRK